MKQPALRCADQVDPRPPAFFPEPPMRGGLVAPEVAEGRRRQRRVPHGVADVRVPEVRLYGPGVAIVGGELVARGMAKHVRVDLERQLGLLPGALQNI
jgi:hypothetical protein